MNTYMEFVVVGTDIALPPLLYDGINNYEL